MKHHYRKCVFSENYWKTGACYRLAAVFRCHCGPLGGGTGCGGPGPAPEQVHHQHDLAQKFQWKNGISRVSSHLIYKLQVINTVT